MEVKLETIVIEKVLEAIKSFSIKDQDKIFGAIVALGQGKFDSVYIKHLTSEIKELRVKKYRLLFFTHKNEVFFVRIFIKKTNKTPKREIELATHFYKLFVNLNQKYENNKRI